MVGAALGLLLAVLVASRSDAIEVLPPDFTYRVWATNAEAAYDVADLDLFESAKNVRCEGYGRERVSRRGVARWRRFDCIRVNPCCRTWESYRVRFTTHGHVVRFESVG